jgi:hypothetical protein
MISTTNDDRVGRVSREFGSTRVDGSTNESVRARRGGESDASTRDVRWDVFLIGARVTVSLVY